MNTDTYQRMRAELYVSQHPGVGVDDALRIVTAPERERAAVELAINPRRIEYTLRLGRSNIPVFDSDDAQRLFCSWRDRFGLGASDLKRDDGKVSDEGGKLICTICYNGRIKLPNGQFLDGMNGQEWLALCAS